ncbi:MAG TPA: hypothetical protein VG271_02585 [Beijerinckiaceae bacterium]|nr:hypothetical protein [Beijerinckiaceae bacterium]
MSSRPRPATPPVKNKFLWWALSALLGISLLYQFTGGFGPRPPPSTQPDFLRYMPTSEYRLVNIVSRGKSAFDAAQNDVQRDASRLARAKELCVAIHPGLETEWVGTVDHASANSDGSGVLSIGIGDDIFVKTWDDSVSDVEELTLIKASEPLFQNVQTLKVGQPVVFSGMLFGSRSDCLKEGRPTQAGSMQSPQFIMRFSDVQVFDASANP